MPDRGLFPGTAERGLGVVCQWASSYSGDFRGAGVRDLKFRELDFPADAICLSLRLHRGACSSAF